MPPSAPSPALAAPASDAPAFGRVMATIGHAARRGRWRLPRRFRAVAWMGGVDVDLTEALIPPDGATLELLAVMGVVTVRVPDDLPAALVGDAVTWSVDADAEPGALALAPALAPARLRVVGRAVLGRVHVRVVRAPARAAG